MAVEKTKCVLKLTDATREFLKLTNWPQEIPEGANYIAFFEDGNACYLESIDMNGALVIPHMHFITYYTTPFDVETGD
jgi:hypothetical protein